MNPFDGSAPAEPLCWWTQAQLEAMAARLRAPWSAWLADWVPGARVAAAVECRLAWDTPAPRAQACWQGLGVRGAAHAWVADDADPGLQLLFGTPDTADEGKAAPAPPIASAIVRTAQRQLADLLRDALALDAAGTQAQPRAALRKPWSGAVCVTLQAPRGAALRLLLNRAAATVLAGVQAAAAPRDARSAGASALVSLSAALAGRALRACVELDGCELELGTLAGLRVGDVIPLAHALDTPLRVSMDGQVLCAGYLGRRGNARAIELARADAPAASSSAMQS